MSQPARPSLVIDPEFQQMIPPLTEAEFQKLEASIRAEGCRDPLVLWGQILIDGHNRYAICMKHNKPFQTIERQFSERIQVKEWIARNQLGRRNLTPFSRGELVLQLDPLFGQRPAGRRKDNQSNLTDYPLEELAGLSHGTLWKIAFLLRHPDLAPLDQLRRGEETIDAAYRALKKLLKQRARQTGDIEGPLPDACRLVLGDFRQELSTLPAQSVDVVFTDPPYRQQDLPLWEALAIEAQRVLKDGGFLIAYSGQRFLDQVMARVGNHLQYYWCLAVEHTHGQLRFWERQVWNSWKPVLIWSQGKPRHEWFHDLLKLDGAEPPATDPVDRLDFLHVGSEDTKDYHAWAQPLAEATEILARLSEPGAFIVDPMCGSGTIPIAAARCGRRALGIESDPVAYEKARKRAGTLLKELL